MAVLSRGAAEVMVRRSIFCLLPIYIRIRKGNNGSRRAALTCSRFLEYPGVMRSVSRNEATALGPGEIADHESGTVRHLSGRRRAAGDRVLYAEATRGRG